MQFKINEVVVESVTKGRNKWQVANVAYSYNGEARTQKLLSFSNPDSFAKVQELQPGDLVEVTITKNDQGYNQWAKIEKVSQAEAAKTSTGNAGSPGRVIGSNYETPEERKLRQLHIVRQSSISNAVNMLTPGAKVAIEVDKVLELADELVDYVYGTEAILEAANAANQEVSGG